MAQVFLTDKQRRCPWCDSVLTYLSVGTRKRADKKNCVCVVCRNEKNRGRVGYWSGKKRGPLPADARRKIGEANSKREWTKESRERLSVSASKWFASPEARLAAAERSRGVVHSESTKEKISATLRDFFARNPPGERSTSSGRVRGRAGWYRGKFHFRSLSELNYILSELEAPGVKWESAEQVKYRVFYTSTDGKRRSYYADFFLIADKVLVEIKSKWFQNDEKVKRKGRAARRHCGKVGWRYVIIGYPPLPRKELEELVDSGLVVLSAGAKYPRR